MILNHYLITICNEKFAFARGFVGNPKSEFFIDSTKGLPTFGEGEQAPAFEAMTTYGEVKLENYRGRKSPPLENNENSETNINNCDCNN